MSATMNDEENSTRTTPKSTRKKDNAPRGVFKHPSGVWAVRFTCGAGHLHKEKVGSIKQKAIATYHERRARAQSEPGWCPAVERAAAVAQAKAQKAAEAQRITFDAYAEQYLTWCQQTDASGQVRKRSWRTIKSELTLLRAAFGTSKLDTITTANVERFIEERLTEVSQATANRYRDRLSAMFKRAERLGLIPKRSNPVTDVPKFRESGGRLVNLTDVQAAAIREALTPVMRPYLDFALHTGFRWSKQMALRWLDVDVLAETLTIGKDKNGNTLRVPFNSSLRTVLTTMATERKRPDDPREPVFPRRYREPDKFFPRAVERARQALRAAGQDDEAARLDGVTWHGLRHTWASRLTMRGVDPRTLQTLGGWRSLAMVERYAHLAPDHLRAAVERLVSPGATAAPTPPSTPVESGEGAVRLARNLPVRHDEPSRVV
jgi:integrase